MAVMDNGSDIKALKVGQKALEVRQEALEAGQEEIKQKLDTFISQNEERFERIEVKLEMV